MKMGKSLLAIFGLFLLPFSGVAFGQQTPTVALSSGSILQIGEAGGQHPSVIRIELTLSEPLTNGQYISFSPGDRSNAEQRVNFFQIRTQGARESLDSLWVPPGTTRPSVYVGTVKDDNIVQRPYAFSLSLGGMTGYNTVIPIARNVVVNSEDVTYIGSANYDPTGTDSTPLDDRYYLFSSKPADFTIHLSYRISTKDGIARRSGFASLGANNEGTYITITGLTKSDLVIVLDPSATTPEGRPFVKIRDNHFTQNGRVVEIHGPDYKFPTTPVVQPVPDPPTTPVVPETPTTPVVPETPVVQPVPDPPTTPVVPETPVVQPDPDPPTTPVVPETPVVQPVPDPPTTPVVPETPVLLIGDFDGDGEVGIPDFLLFVDVFGTQREQNNFDPKFDLDNDGTVGIPDFLIFVDSFGKTTNG